MTDKIYISGIKHDSIVDGNGFRNVIFISGCWWNCCECQNKDTHSPTYGDLYDISKVIDNVTSDKNDITISGGDGLTFQVEKTYKIIKILKERYNRNVWLYTGYTWEEIFNKETKQIIKDTVCLCDVLVDGKYIKSLKDFDYEWAGSSNQRVIDVQKTLQKGEIVLWN